MNKYILSSILFLPVFLVNGAQRPVASGEYNKDKKIAWLLVPGGLNLDAAIASGLRRDTQLPSIMRRRAEEYKHNPEDFFKKKAGSVTRVVVNQTYKKVFHPIVQAVLAGDNKEFKALLKSLKSSKSPKFSLHDKLPYGRSLRHIAYNEHIDARLLSHGVAKLDKRICFFEPSEFDIRYKIADSVTRAYIEREPDDADVYGKFPENYTYDQRREIAKQMMEDPYVYVVEETESE